MIGAFRFALAGAVLAAASTQAWPQAGAPLIDTVPSITVEGDAKREVAPDLAVVTLGVVTDRPTAPQASTDNAQAAAALAATAKSAGLAGADIRTSEIRLAAITDSRDASKIRTFRASNQLTLRVHDLTEVGSLIGQLAAQGANDIDGIAFTVADPDPILDELRAAATTDAARKAAIYAKAAGLKLGRILRIVPQGSSMPLPAPRAYKMQVAAAAPVTPVEAGTDTLEAHVQITWELSP